MKTKIVFMALFVILLFLISGIQSSSSTKEEIAISQLRIEIDSLHIQIHKLKNDIDELSNEILSINRKLYYLEFRNK